MRLLSDWRAAALETHLAERASRLGRQLHYRIQIRSIEHVGMLVEAGIGMAILSEASARTLRGRRLAILPLSEPWAARRLHLRARDFAALTPHADLLAKQLIEGAGRWLQTGSAATAIPMTMRADEAK